jgi:hypothetical protein
MVVQLLLLLLLVVVVRWVVVGQHDTSLVAKNWGGTACRLRPDYLRRRRRRIPTLNQDYCAAPCSECRFGTSVSFAPV